MTQAPAIPLPRSCEVSQKFFFDAAHTLKRTVDDAEEIAGSRRIHGHTYHAEVTIAGKPDPESGMMMDLAFLRQEVDKVREKLDHLVSLGVTLLYLTPVFPARSNHRYDASTFDQVDELLGLRTRDKDPRSDLQFNMAKCGDTQQVLQRHPGNALRQKLLDSHPLFRSNCILQDHSITAHR